MDGNHKEQIIRNISEDRILKYAYRQERNLPCSQGVTLRHIVSELGHANVVSLLLSGGYDKINDLMVSEMTALALAARSGHSTIFERLLQCDKIGIKSLADASHVAAKNDQKDVIDRLSQEEETY
ncbi:hypothetical protein J3459_007642 [Metarhizium acridum]|nr:hypothetical protein J3458_007103 [Metarhizium acridum]KAG8426974.1 hypothetical protein J3459_007642 [Metarhizium acridum]